MTVLYTQMKQQFERAVAQCAALLQHHTQNSQGYSSGGEKSLKVDVGGSAEVAPTVVLLDTAENNVKTHKLVETMKSMMNKDLYRTLQCTKVQKHIEHTNPHTGEHT